MCLPVVMCKTISITNLADAISAGNIELITNSWFHVVGNAAVSRFEMEPLLKYRYSFLAGACAAGGSFFGKLPSFLSALYFIQSAYDATFVREYWRSNFVLNSNLPLFRILLNAYPAGGADALVQCCQLALLSQGPADYPTDFDGNRPDSRF